MPEIKESRLSPETQKPNGSTATPSSRETGAHRDVPADPSQGINPFAFMRRFVEDMDHIFEDFGMSHGLGAPRLVSRGRELLRREAGLIQADWSPQVDVLERDGKFIVRADLPGMARKDLQVDIKDEMLTIQGVRNKETHEEKEGRYYSERSHGRFYRAIPLPDGVHADKASAQFRDGVLEVTMPCPPSAKPASRRLEIKEGD